MRRKHQHRGKIIHNGVAFNNPEWYIDRLTAFFDVPEISISLFISDGEHTDMVDIELTLHTLTESNVILAIENYFLQQI